MTHRNFRLPETQRPPLGLTTHFWLFSVETAMKSVGNKITQKPSPKEECAQRIVRGGVLRYREVFYPYWALKPTLIYRELLPNLLDQVIGYGYRLENIL